MPPTPRISTLRALDERGVTCYDTMYVDRAKKGALIVRHHFSHKREMRLANVSAVVWLGVQRINDSLAEELRGAGIREVRVVGDAYSPRRLTNAISEGHRAARAV